VHSALGSITPDLGKAQCLPQVCWPAPLPHQQVQLHLCMLSAPAPAAPSATDSNPPASPATVCTEVECSKKRREKALSGVHIKHINGSVHQIIQLMEWHTHIPCSLHHPQQLRAGSCMACAHAIHWCMSALACTYEQASKDGENAHGHKSDLLLDSDGPHGDAVGLRTGAKEENPPSSRGSKCHECRRTRDDSHTAEQQVEERIIRTVVDQVQLQPSCHILHAGHAERLRHSKAQELIWHSQGRQLGLQADNGAFAGTRAVRVQHIIHMLFSLSL
jgi:hypothetical protein